VQEARAANDRRRGFEMFMSGGTCDCPDATLVLPNVRAKVAPAVWRAGTAAQNWGEAPAPQAQCATPLGLSLSEGLGLAVAL
jgi:hypothetical protein